MLHFSEEFERNYQMDTYWYFIHYVTSYFSRVNGHFKKVNSILEFKGNKNLFQLKEKGGHQLFKFEIN